MRRIRSILLAALVIGLLASPAQAAVKSATVLRVDPVAAVAWGDRALVTAHLSLSDGSALANVHVDLRINADVSGGRTDSAGKAVFTPKAPVNPGTYIVTVTFSGSSTLLPSQASRTLTVQPRLLTIYTMPAVPGLPFVLDGKQFVSDAKGIAQTVVQPTFDETKDLPNALPLRVAPGIEERFARWRSFNGDIFATYEMYYDISLKFIDLAGNRIDPSRVTKVTFKSAIGALISVSPDQTFTVLGQRVVALAGELLAKDITYAAQDVVVDGSSVVHVAQQRYTPSVERAWTIQLLFYAAHFSVHDALFGFPIDATVAVTYPDGHEVDMKTTKGELSMVALARGDYHVAARGWGIAFSRPVSLSRDQQVDLKFISYLDVGVVVALVLVVALGLVALGRTGGPWNRAPWLRRRPRPALAGGAAAAASGDPMLGAGGGGSQPIPTAPAGAVPSTTVGGALATRREPFTPGPPMSTPARATRTTRPQASPATEPIASRLHAILATEPMATRLQATRVTAPQAGPEPDTLEARLEATRRQAARATERARIRPQATPVAKPAVTAPIEPAPPTDAPAEPPAKTRAARQAKPVPAASAKPVAKAPTKPVATRRAAAATTRSPKAVATPRAKPAPARTKRATASAAEPAPAADELLEGGEYIVKRGDTLKSIAARLLGSADSWQEIVRANPDVVIERGRILPGTRLKIR